METKAIKCGYGDVRIRRNGMQNEWKIWNGNLLQKVSKLASNENFADASLGQDENGYDVIPLVPELDALPLYEDGETIGVFDCADDCWQVLLQCESKESAVAYFDLLVKEGFVERTAKEMADNLFRQYEKDGLALHVLYTPAFATLRIVTEPTGKATFSQSTPETYEKRCTTMLTQIGLGCDAPGRVHNDHENDISMSYVLRLCDGRFIVWDGGMPWPEYEERLLTVLQNQTLEGEKPVIATWILTHAHPDHTGLFDVFAEKHTEDVVVETVMHNFHSEYSGEGAWQATYHNKLRGEIAKFGAKAIKAHTGMDLFFADARIEIMYDQELMAPRPIRNLNTASLVTRLFVEDKSALFLADHADASSKSYPHFNNGAMRQLFGGYLKSDFVQVAHHGLGGGASRELYEMVDAKYVLWPIGEAKFLYHKLGEKSSTAFFKHEDQLVCHAFQRIYVFEWTDEGMKWTAYTTFEEYKRRVGV